MRYRLTVVENDEDVRLVMREILEAAGYAVTAVSLAGGRHALRDALVDAEPDLIILDLRLGGDLEPDRAWDLLRELRGDEALGAVPVLVCSADSRALKDHAAEVQFDPMVGTLTKPFGIDELEQRVARLLDARRVPQWRDEDELVLVADAESRLVDASVCALRLLGLSIDELRSLSVADIVAETREWTATEWQRYLTAGAWRGEVRLRTAGGELLASSEAEILNQDGHMWHVSRLKLLGAGDGVVAATTASR